MTPIPGTVLDYEALICLGAAMAGGTVVVRCPTDGDASAFLHMAVEWAARVGFPHARTRTWRLTVGENRGSIETAPHDYETPRSSDELVRDLPILRRTDDA